MTLILLLFSLLILAFVCYICYKLQYPKHYEILSKFPAPNFPVTLGFLVSPDIIIVTKVLNQWFRQFGSPTCLKAAGQYFVFIFTPEHVEALLKSTCNTEKGDTYRLMECWLGKGLLTNCGESWRQRRKLLTPAFHFGILNQFLPIMIEQSEILVQLLKQQNINEKPIDICSFIKLCSLDILCETAMGRRINAQKVKSSPYVDAILEFTETTMYRATHPWAWSDFLFYKCSKMGRKLTKSLKIMHDFTNQVINEREHQTEKVESKPEKVKRRLAFLDLLLEMKRNGYITHENVREEVDTFMFEGHDTTATGIIWTCYCLGLYPECQTKVQEEVDQLFESLSEGESLTSEHLSGLKYLERCIKESHRLYPPVPQIERKLDKDLKLDDKYTVPAGTTVGVIFYQLHRNPTQFPNPRMFDPDRFLPENSAKLHPFAFCPFSGGPRNCIGQKFAMMEEKVVLCNLLRNFSLQATQKHQDLHLANQFVLRSYDGIYLILKERNTI